MQQTAKYKFNLIETSDTFNPDALNANAETAERELAAVRGELAAGDAALAQTAAADKSALEQSIAGARAALQAAIGSGGKTCRIAHGNYVGNGNCGPLYPNSLVFDFKPHMIIFLANSNGMQILMRGVDTSFAVITWGENQVSWYVTNISPTNQQNQQGVTYYYVAVGESL